MGYFCWGEVGKEGKLSDVGYCQNSRFYLSGGVITLLYGIN